eukprot:TRINITY_DN24028_c0_g2_i1.p1 TRINITY_DN24028_c0_g2~~TRINITY_DN24028_c0_g2_i1.p1  ORF type:complete len:477 (+),score=97.22 TRINITY_DN24028_c0_g2_i1:78-1508(+)
MSSGPSSALLPAARGASGTTAAGALARTAACLLAAAAAAASWRWLRLLRKRHSKRKSEEDSYDISFFDAEVDRSSVFTVKHGLKQLIFGESAADSIALWVADMDLPCAPEIVSALQERLKHPTIGYTYQPGEMWSLVQAWLQKEFRWNVPTDSFLFCPSVVTSAAACVWSFTQPGDTVALMTPLYEPLQNLVVGAGRQLRKHALTMVGGRYYIDFARLGEDLEGCRMLIFCNPHNPGGRVWSAEELRKLLALCRAKDILVVSDEIWADWCLFDSQHRPLAMHADAEASQHVITLMAPSKTWNLAGVHCSFLVIQDPTLRARYLATVDYAFLHYGNAFATEAMIAAYRFGRPWLHGARKYIESQLLRATEVLRARGAPELQPAALPEATYLLWLDCSGLNVEDPARFFREEASVTLSPGADFGGASTKDFVRLNVAVSRRILDAALQRMVMAVERHRLAHGCNDDAAAHTSRNNVAA